MSHLKVRFATPEDYLSIEPREPHPIAPTREGIETFFTYPGQAAYAIESRGFPFAILGVWRWAIGLGLGWGLISRRANPRDVSLLIAGTRRFLPTLECRRIEATVAVGFEAGTRFIEALGFIREEIAEGYGEDGTPHYRYARVFPEHFLPRSPS